MRKGIRIRFNTAEGPASIRFDDAVTGFSTVAQNAFVNLGTESGTDSIFPTKGTMLFRRALLGELLSPDERAHQTSLAAEQTRLFIRENERSRARALGEEVPPEYELQKLGLQLSSIDYRKIVFNTFAVSAAGQTVGVEIQELV